MDYKKTFLAYLLVYPQSKRLHKLFCPFIQYLFNRFYCLAATSGTFRFILENEDFVFAEHTIKFSYQGAEGIKNYLVFIENKAKGKLCCK